MAVIILCRFSSTRLPGKILKKINDKSVLEYILDRVKVVFSKEQIIVATSTDISDQPIADFCTIHGFQFYRGDLRNVSDRFLKAAQSLNATYAIRINGDNLFVDVPLLKEFKEVIENNNYDFISNVKDRTYPKGMSIEAVKVDFYQGQTTQFEAETDFEHVTSFLYKYPPSNAYYFYNRSIPEAAGIQLAIDTLEDFEMATDIMLQIKGNPEDYSLEDIYQFYKKLK